MRARICLLLLSVILLFGGCSSFNRDWNKAADQSFEGMEGRWIGRWHSDYNQHNGVLRCLITKRKGETYHTRFHAKYKLSFITVSYPYDMDMTLTPQGDTFIFTGQADLGKLAGGLYHYDGNGTVQRIDINYRADKDHGTFLLERPEDSE
jgi:hypothetical protein